MAKISGVTCAFNEEARITKVLDVLVEHPALDEIIVVDDGSADATAQIAAAYPKVRLISYKPNRGKSHALSVGIRNAKNEYLVFIDADLAGLTSQNVTALVEPVLTGKADVSISMRANSLSIYRFLGIDFVSGERVVPRALFTDVLTEIERLPHWGCEVFMNNLFIRKNLRVAVVRWPNVYNVRKFRKVGPFHGFLEEIAMVRDALKVVSPLKAVRQYFGLLRLMTDRPKFMLWLGRRPALITAKGR